jgi:hypothetical protein
MLNDTDILNWIEKNAHRMGLPYLFSSSSGEHGIPVRRYVELMMHDDSLSLQDCLRKEQQDIYDSLADIMNKHKVEE